MCKNALQCMMHPRICFFILDSIPCCVCAGGMAGNFLAITYANKEIGMYEV